MKEQEKSSKVEINSEVDMDEVLKLPVPSEDEAVKFIQDNPGLILYALKYLHKDRNLKFHLKKNGDDLVAMFTTYKFYGDEYQGHIVNIEDLKKGDGGTE